MPELLSDETWRQLDRSAGRLSRRDLRWALLGAAAFVAVMTVVLTGLVVPRLANAGGWGYGYDEDTWLVHQEFGVRNDGSFPVDIIDVGRDGPGLALADVSYPLRVEPGESASVEARYEVTDCAAVPREPWPVPVRMARPWGTHTLWIELPRQSPMDFDLPPTHSSGDAVTWADDVEWQRNLADAVCYHRYGIVPDGR
ncbi:MAG TPA: hypothetical protein VK925_02395 [Jiangellaceae bacterium]|nr:hypothetical protein [Jiangellaceae bacterium]